MVQWVTRFKVISEKAFFRQRYGGFWRVTSSSSTRQNLQWCLPESPPWIGITPLGTHDLRAPQLKALPYRPSTTRLFGSQETNVAMRSYAHGLFLHLWHERRPETRERKGCNARYEATGCTELPSELRDKMRIVSGRVLLLCLRVAVNTMVADIGRTSSRLQTCPPRDAMQTSQ